MLGTDADPFDPASPTYRRRYWTLAALCFSLLLTALDNTILNVALPTLVRELDATNSELQWIVESYVLVFAGLLLAAGSLGDRYGRRGAYQIGLAVFGVGSLASVFAASPLHLILTRAVMGLGAAFIMPATLSILTNVFPAHERARAIGIWAAVSGLGVAIGPLAGGFLLEHFSWSSIFWINVPVIVVALAATVVLVPTSRDPSPHPTDVPGVVLSIAGLTGLVYAIIEAPDFGWTDGRTLGWAGISLAVLAAFVLWELRTPHPMLDVRFFRNPRFSAASTSITLVMFALFGSGFLMTQYMQFVLGFSPLEAGVRMVPVAMTMMVVAPLSPRLVERVGSKIVVVAGLFLVVTGLALYTGVRADGTYLDLIWRVLFLSAGVGLAMAPATESIMGALPRAKAGVGSAVNDATRQVGGLLGVAVIGSAMSSSYIAGLRPATRLMPPDVAAHVNESLGAALAVAARVGGEGGAQLAQLARTSFVDGLHRGALIGSLIALVGALVSARFLPARAVAAAGEPAEAGDASALAVAPIEPAVAEP